MTDRNKTARVMDVGQCVPDHMALKRVVESLGGEIVQVATPADALKILRDEAYRLVFVNRKIDQDYSDGMALVHAMQADSSLSRIPVMLISNFPEAQAEAVAAGAVQGFGKSELSSQHVRKLLAPYLSAAATSA